MRCEYNKVPLFLFCFGNNLLIDALFFAVYTIREMNEEEEDGEEYTY